MHFIILMYRCYFFNINTGAFSYETCQKKNFCYNLRLPNFFSYIEHLLKPLQLIEEVVLEGFLKKNSNLVALKPLQKFPLDGVILIVLTCQKSDLLE
jgi:hypothetical protein